MDCTLGIEGHMWRKGSGVGCLWGRWQDAVAVLTILVTVTENFGIVIVARLILLVVHTGFGVIVLVLWRVILGTVVVTGGRVVAVVMAVVVVVLIVGTTHTVEVTVGVTMAVDGVPTSNWKSLWNAIGAPSSPLLEITMIDHAPVQSWFLRLGLDRISVGSATFNCS